MPIQIVRNDMTKMEVDAIVNAANDSLLGGGGVDGAIHRAAGPELLAECRTLGGCRTGDAKITSGYRLPSKYVIHTVCPVWRGGFLGEKRKLESCYRRSLELAKAYNCESIAFPLISSGVYGYPKDKALKVAMDTVTEFLLENEMTVYIVVFDRSAHRISEKLLRDVTAFIDDQYVDSHTDSYRERMRGSFFRPIPKEECSCEDTFPASFPMAAPSEQNISRADQGSAIEEKPTFAISDDAVFATEDSVYDEEYACPTLPKLKRGRRVFRLRPAPKANRSLYPGAAAPAASVVPMSVSLEEWLKKKDAGFAETLVELIEKSGKKNSEIYKKANVDKKLFSKIINNVNYHPSKATALAFAIALELNLEETREFIGRAGYALTKSSKFDLIVEFFIARKNYNIMEINLTLFEFDQSLLGS